MLLDRREMRRRVPHHRSGDQQVDGGDGVLPARRRPGGVGAGLGDQHGQHFDGGVEIADEQQVLEQPDHRLHQLAPAPLILLDAQQVEDQREVERAERGRRDRAQPLGDAIRGVVVDVFDFDRLRARARQFAAVGVGDVVLVGIGGQ
jgi:hypothetical protein